MNNQNFYLRLIALLLIIMAVFFYNGTVKDKEQAQDIADLTAKTESLEKQQDQILTALKETYEAVSYTHLDVYKRQVMFCQRVSYFFL